ncbi:MAG: aconitase X, partial [Actinomycetota bacterium]
LDAATGGHAVAEIVVTPERLRSSRDELGPGDDAALGAVCVGTPHASVAELERLGGLVDGRPLAVPLWVNTGRDVLAEADRRGVRAALESAGVRIVTDTCTYLSPLIGDVEGVVMTDSGKWAWYAPANLGVRVVVGGLDECVRSAIAGRVVRDPALWADG